MNTAKASAAGSSAASGAGAQTAAAHGGQNPAQRMDAVTGAFERVHARQTGLSAIGRTQPLEQAAKLRELDELVRENQISERIARLRTGQA